MTPRLVGQNCKFFEDSILWQFQKETCVIEYKENQTKSRKMTRKPRSDRTWAFIRVLIINEAINIVISS